MKILGGKANCKKVSSSQKYLQTDVYNNFIRTAETWSNQDAFSGGDG